MRLFFVCVLFLLAAIQIARSDIDHGNAGDLAFQQGNFQQAKEHYRIAIEEAASSGPYLQGVDPNISRFLECEARLGELKAQRESLLQKIKAIEVKDGKYSSSLAYPLNLFAQISAAGGNYAEATTSLERALEIYRKGLAKKDPSISYLLNSLAFLYHLTNQKNATDLFHESLKLRQERLKEDPLQDAISLANRAWESTSATQAQNRFALSVKCFEASGLIKHPYLAEVLRSYALLLEKSGDSKKAQELRIRADEILSSLSAPSHAPEL
jgi:tetratricopeptide (TPR) repeat protein